MPDQLLPENLQKRYKATTVDEMWVKNLTEGNIYLKRYRPLYGRLPSNPRCVNCHRPFAGIGGMDNQQQRFIFIQPSKKPILVPGNKSSVEK